MSRFGRQRVTAAAIIETALRDVPTESAIEARIPA
jgi:hypothetical protein